MGRMVRTDPSTLGRIANICLSHLQWPKQENADAVQTAARHEVVKLESGLFILEIVTGIAPLLGLLGAVTGLVQVFDVFGNTQGGAPDSQLIARGIAEALSTTIVGLGIAIPTLIAYSFFSKRVETLAADLELLASSLITKCYQQKRTHQVVYQELSREEGGL
jgi:biopolymer transport protein ExbB